MKKRILWALLICLLLSGCGPEPGHETTGTTAAPGLQVKMPPALEDGFALCTDLIDIVLCPASCSGEFAVYILSHEPLTVEDIQVQIDGLEKLELYLHEIDKDQYWTGQGAMEDHNWIRPFNMFCCYQDIDWEEIDRLDAEIEKADGPNGGLIAAQDAILAPYQKAFIEAKGAFPKFYAYQLNVSLYDFAYFSDPALGAGKTFTKLSVAVKGKTVDLSDRFSVEIVTREGFPEAPAEACLSADGGPVGMGMSVTSNGKFTTPVPVQLTATENITITDIGFWNCDTSRLTSVEITNQSTGTNQKWDGEMPIEITAGETVALTINAEDPMLADLICGTIDRFLAINYTVQGAEYTRVINLNYKVRNDPYVYYAHAQDTLRIELVRDPQA